MCSQLSALLRLRAILFAARVPLRLDRRFWSCLWAQHWPYTGFSGEIGLEWIDMGRAQGSPSHHELFYLCKYDAAFYKADLKTGH